MKNSLSTRDVCYRTDTGLLTGLEFPWKKIVIQAERIKILGDATALEGDYVLYWMQAARRSEYNHALEYAIEQANTQGIPVVVVFCLVCDFPEANARHYSFMLEGLKESQDSLALRGIQMVVLQEPPELGVPRIAKQASLVVVDGGYLRIQRRWRKNVATRTHDVYWNAALQEMVETGKMHDYMRMYWGKKIIEWSKSAQSAFKIALYLNNKYELDGRDPNGFAGIAWCFGKHDRPWAERPIFGLVRYMNAKGLKRKFNIDVYVQKIQDLGRTQAEHEGSDIV